MSKKLEESIESAMDGHGVIKTPVHVDKLHKVAHIVRRAEVPHVQDQIVKIINDCDPIGFLSDIVNGKAIETFEVNAKGQVKSNFVAPSLPQRINAAKFLAERYLPKVGVIKHAHLHKHETSIGKHETGRSFEQIITHAAGKKDDLEL